MVRAASQAGMPDAAAASVSASAMAAGPSCPSAANLVTELRVFKARQAAERLAAGPAYADGGSVTSWAPRATRPASAESGTA